MNIEHQHDHADAQYSCPFIVHVHSRFIASSLLSEYVAYLGLVEPSPLPEYRYLAYAD